jgi:hypothetical protein
LISDSVMYFRHPFTTFFFPQMLYAWKIDIHVKFSFPHLQVYLEILKHA